MVAVSSREYSRVIGQMVDTVWVSRSAVSCEPMEV